MSEIAGYTPPEAKQQPKQETPVSQTAEQEMDDLLEDIELSDTFKSLGEVAKLQGTMKDVVKLIKNRKDNDLKRYCLKWLTDARQGANDTQNKLIAAENLMTELIKIKVYLEKQGV